MTWRATVLTLFPEMFPGPLGQSLAGRALKDGIWALDALQIRDFAQDKHRTVDDTPCGGGAGMVMKPDVVDAACEGAFASDRAAAQAAERESDAAQPDRAAAQAKERESAAPKPDRELVYLTPRGAPLTQAMVRGFAASPGVVLLCGRYEGVDQRVVDARRMREVSVGDFVLSGGEPAALVLLDACIRLLPGVMGAADSAVEESFSAGLLEYPHYTRPVEWQGRAVPPVLLSGHHAEITKWRHAEAERLTQERRPDLFNQYVAAARGTLARPPAAA